MEIKDIASTLGLKEEDFKDNETFLSAFEKVYVAENRLGESEIGRRFSGNLLGGVNTKIKSIAKKFGVDTSTLDLKDKPYDQQLEMVMTSFNETHTQTLEDLKAQGGKGNDEKVLALEKKYNELKGKYDQTEGLLLTEKQEREKAITEFANKEKTIKIDYAKQRLFSGAKFRKDVNDYAVKGFKSEFESKYDLEIDDKGELATIKTKDGKQIASKNSATVYLTPAEVFERDAIEGKLWEENPSGGREVGNRFGQNNNGGNGGNGNNGNNGGGQGGYGSAPPMHPNAIAAAQN